MNKYLKFGIVLVGIGSLLGLAVHGNYLKKKEMTELQVLYNRTDKGGPNEYGDPWPEFGKIGAEASLINDITGGNIGKYAEVTYNTKKATGSDADESTKYIEILPMNIAGYENWTPSGEKSQYSLENISNNLRYNSDSTKQITNARAEKVIKNENGKLSYPESTVVRIAVTFEVDNREETYTGTGVMIGRNKILTCAHLFYLDGEVKLEEGELCTYSYNGNILDIEIQADAEQLVEETVVGNIILGKAEKLYVSSEYIEKVKQMEQSVAEKKYNMSKSDADVLRQLFENDFAVLEVKNKEEGEKEIWEETGWIGILPFETTGNQKWGTLYGYPEIVPNLPSLDKLIECLKIDANSRWMEYYKRGRGISIRLNDAIEALYDIEGSKEHYRSLLDKNGIEMYSSYDRLNYTSEFPMLLKYDISTYSGDSGAPIIQSVYNSRLNKYFPYTSGIHCGYVVSKDELDEKNGDLWMYVYDYLNRVIDFNKPYEPDTPEIDSWTVGLQICGYNYGRQIDKALYNYLLANDIYPGYSYTPKDREER